MSFSQGAPTQPLSIVASNVFLTGSSAGGNAFTVQQLSVGNVASFLTSTGLPALTINATGLTNVSNLSVPGILINGVPGSAGQVIQATGVGANIQWGASAGLSQGVLYTLPSAYTLGAPFFTSTSTPQTNAYHINLSTTFTAQAAAAVSAFSIVSGLIKFTSTGLYQLTCVLAGDQPIVKLAVGTSSSASFGSSTTAYTYVYNFPVNSSPSEVVTVPLNVTDVSKYYYIDAYFQGNATQLYLTSSGSASGTNNGTWIQISPFGSYLSSATGVASALLANCSTSSNLSGVYSSNAYRVTLTSSNGWTVNGTSTSLAVTSNGNFQVNQAGIYEVNLCLNTVGQTPVQFQVGSLSSDSAAPGTSTPAYLYAYAPMYTQDPTTVIQLPLNITNISNVYFVECSFAGTLTGNVALTQTSTFVSIKPIGGYINMGTNPWVQQGTTVYYNAGRVGLGVVPTTLTETLTVNGNTSFVANVTQVTDSSGSFYTSYKRNPLGSLPVSSYVTGSVPLTTTTNLIQNYLSNAATITANTSTGSVTQVLNLPGTTNSNSFLNFPPSISATFSNLATSNLFIEAWINPTVIAGANRTILQRNLGGTADFYFFVSSAGILSASILNTGGGTAASASSATTISTGSWVHVAFSYARTSTTAGTLYVFVNGVVGATTGTVSTQPRVTPTANICIGGDTLSTSMFTGNVADVRVMTGCIVPVAGFTPQSAPFTTAPTYRTGMDTGYTSNLTLALQSQYFPGASTSPYGPCLTLPGTVGSYYSAATSVATAPSSGFTFEAWVNYASLANANTYYLGSQSNMFMRGSPTATSLEWAFGATTTGAIVLYYYNGTSNYGLISSGTITTGSWNHLVVQSNANAVNMYINGTQQTMTGQNYTPTGSGTVSCSWNGSVTSSYNAFTVGQYNSGAGANFAMARARLLFGANTYTTTSFTPNPNFASVPAGATVAWQLETQYPLPTYPSIQDVTELPQQASSYGSLPTPVGGVTSNISGPYPGTYPQLQSLRFDGTGYIDYGNAATSVMTTNLWASNWTIEGWVYPVSVPCQLFERSNLASGFDFSANVNASGQVNFYYGASTVGPTLATVPINTWTHVAVTYDGTRSNIYVSSNTIGTANISTTVTGSQAFVPTYSFHTGYNSVAGNYLNGNLADVRVSNVARYTGSTYTVPTAPFTTDANTLLLLKSLAGQVGTTLEVQGRGLNAVSLGATRSVQSYPPAPFTSNNVALVGSYMLDTTGNTAVTYGQGKYVASSSSEYNSPNSAQYASYNAFDKNTSGSDWACTALYSAGAYTGTVVTTDTLGNSYPGEWIQLQMPVSVLLSSFTSYNANPYGPTLFWLLGSRDGINWTLVYKYSGSSFATQTFAVSATQSYNYYRFVAGTLLSGYATTNMYELIFTGTEESLCVTSDSKVGVGIANPQRSLEVAGDLVVSGTISGGAGMGSFRNRIINGDMRIAQRGASANIAPTSGSSAIYGSVDRWFTWTRVASLISVQQSSTVPLGLGFTYSWLITSLSGYTVVSGDYHGIGQYIEGYNIADLNWGTSYGVPVTLSFWIRSSTAGNYSFSLEGGAGFAPSYAVQYTINNPNTWQQIVLTIPPPPNGYTGNFSTTNSAGVRLWWDLGSSDATYAITTPGIWQAGDKLRVAGSTNFISTNGATMYITGVQLEKGTVATPFDARSYATELALCQRYFYQMTSAAASYTCFGAGWASAAGGYFVIPFPVPMRTGVSSLSASAASTFYVATTAGNATASSIAIQASTGGTNSVELVVGSSATTAGQGALLNANGTTSAFIGFSAEL